MTDILKDVRDCVESHKQKKPEPTQCPQCSYRNGGAFTVCPLCSYDMLVKDYGRDPNQLTHPGDVAVLAVSIGISVLHITGELS